MFLRKRSLQHFNVIVGVLPSNLRIPKDNFLKTFVAKMAGKIICIPEILLENQIVTDRTQFIQLVSHKRSII